jgi:hypothetical protein
MTGGESLRLSRRYVAASAKIAFPIRPIRGDSTKQSVAHKAHPHPSGAADPSQADELITRRLKEALALVDVRLLDHIIVAGGDAISFADRGLL